jgi:hypothetical protein
MSISSSDKDISPAIPLSPLSSADTLFRLFACVCLRVCLLACVCWYECMCMHQTPTPTQT